MRSRTIPAPAPERLEPSGTGRQEQATGEGERAGATDASGGAESWSEWNLSDKSTPERYRRFGSPTVLVDGEDVTGADGGNAAMASRADGAPSVAVIRGALSR